MKKIKYYTLALLGLAMIIAGCDSTGKSSNGALSSSAAEKVYVAPGEQDEYYAFLSAITTAG